MFAEERNINCPYCGEPISILVDPLAVPQEYIEDCQVCCRPMEIAVSGNDGEDLQVSVRAEDEAR